MIVNAPFQEALPTLEKRSVQLCFTSPPYEDIINYRSKNRGELYTSGLKGEPFIQLYWEELFTYLWEVMADDGIVGIVINDKREDRFIRTTNLEGVLRVCNMGWGLCEFAPWIKKSGIPRQNRCLQDWWERIFLFSKSSEYKFYPERIRGEYADSTKKRYEFGGKVRKIEAMSSRMHSAGKDKKLMGEDEEMEQHNVLHLNDDGKLLPNIVVVNPDSSRRNFHPARFPLLLAEWAIALCTDVHDLVIDPMCGSGTTLIQAKRMARRYWGSDIGSDYCESAMKELEDTPNPQLSFLEDQYSTEVPLE